MKLCLQYACIQLGEKEKAAKAANDRADSKTHPKTQFPFGKVLVTNGRDYVASLVPSII